jgi:NAD(P)-dependent dehydrogenase (short-subunit alcohol dehydrogenase family)
MDSADFRLSDQVAVVTGGGGGLGRAIALALASAGADVAVADIVSERCEEACQRVAERGRRALPLHLDVRDTDRVGEMVAAAEAHFGRIDILVNNAGGVVAKPFIDQSQRAWRRAIDLNLVSMLAATSAAVPVMIRGGRGGTIINVASIEAFRAAPGFSVYAACKAGMVNFTRTLALELAEHGIRVNAIAPDYIETPGLRGNITGPVDPDTWLTPSAAHSEATARRIPLGRIGRPEEVGHAALFLASGMSDYITGTTLHVDGGTMASSGWIRDDEGHWSLTGQRRG